MNIVQRINIGRHLQSQSSLENFLLPWPLIIWTKVSEIQETKKIQPFYIQQYNNYLSSTIVTRFLSKRRLCNVFSPIFYTETEARPQSRQSARLFLQSSELGHPPPLPHPQANVSLTLGPGGDTLACGRREGGGPNSDEGTDTVVFQEDMYFVSQTNIKEIEVAKLDCNS